MTDKELLEYAAKAYGILKPRYVENTSWGTGISTGEGDEIYTVWNPLKDDGAALRLAVKLKVEIINDGYMCVVRQKHPHKFGAQESLCQDEYAATRRAIVRAAASMGSAME